jgi:carbonic anhydrase
MKNKFLIILCLGTCVLNAQTTVPQKAIWDYPVKPGSKE